MRCDCLCVECFQLFDCATSSCRYQMGLLSCIADLYKLGPALKHIVAAKMDKKSLYYSKENVEVHWNDRLLVVNKKQIQGWREKSTESLITAINSSRSMSSSR